MRTKLIILTVLGIVLTASPAMAAWVAPHELGSELGIRTVHRGFRLDPLTGLSVDGPYQHGQIISVGSIAATRALDVAPGSWVMYDIERWLATPKEEQEHPYRSMRHFVTTARQMGYVAVLAPAGIWRDRAADLDADVFLAQVQNIMDPVKYRGTVCSITRRFDGPVYAELSASNRPGHTVKALMAQWYAGRVCTKHFAMWGDPANMDVLSEVIQRTS